MKYIRLKKAFHKEEGTDTGGKDTGDGKGGNKRKASASEGDDDEGGEKADKGKKGVKVKDEIVEEHY
jgi:hypothetical protein